MSEAPRQDRVAALWTRTKEHRIAQWAVGYVAVAYGIQHAVILTSESFEWPNIVARVAMLLLALGLPLAMTLAWYHGQRVTRRVSGGEMTIVSLLLVLISFAFFFMVQPAGQVFFRTEAASFAAPASGISLAVLPFVNLSSDKEQEFFSDGMTEEITSALAKVKGLTVVARTSAFEFKGRNKDVRAIAQALSASHVIEGSVRKAGDRVRITAQLIRADTGAHLWTDSYDRQLTDIFAIQEDIAHAIAASLQVPLGLSKGETLVSNRSIEPEGYQNYLRAKGLVRVRGIKPLTDAAALLEQVVARDSNYAPAWALLSQAYALTPNYVSAWYGGTAAELRRVADATTPKAEAAARRAIALSPNGADGYLALGFIQTYRGQMVPAEANLVKGLAIDPNNPDGLHFYSGFLSAIGRSKQALELRQKLQRLEPLVPVFNWNLGRMLWVNGEDDPAIALLKNLPELYDYRAASLAQIFASLGRYRDAANSLLTIAPGVYAPGAVAEAARIIRAAPRALQAVEHGPQMGHLDFVYLYSDAPGRALEMHENGVAAGYMVSVETAQLWHPSYAALRKTERFKSLARNLGLVDYWRAKGWPDLCHPTTTDDFACE